MKQQPGWFSPLNVLDSVPPAQGASSLGVVLVVVQAQQQLGQVRVDLMVPDAGEDLEQQ